MKLFFAILFLIQLMTFQAFSKSLEGEFLFESNIPEVGLVYFEENIASNNDSKLVDQKNKEFIKKLIVISKNGRIMFKNSDTFEHNIYVTLDEIIKEHLIFIF